MSHLDLQKTFQRAFRRAKVELIYSEGFHPHPKMTYSPPLPLFVSSAEEYLDVSLGTLLTEDEIAMRLREAFPPGITLRFVHMLGGGDPSLSDYLGWGDYEFILEKEGFGEETAKALCAFFKQAPSIMIQKLNKKKQLVDKDVKPGVKRFAAAGEDGRLTIEASLSLENDTLLNPTLFLEALKVNLPALQGARTVGIRKLRVIPKKITAMEKNSL